MLLCAVVGCTSNGDSYAPATCADYPRVAFESPGNLTLSTGGTVAVGLKCYLPDLPGSATWDVPSTARVSGDAVSAHAGAAKLVIEGLHAGTSTVEIVDGSHVYGALTITVKDFDHLTIPPDPETVPPNASVVYANEADSRLGLALASSDGAVLRDDYEQVTLPPGISPGYGPGSFDVSTTPVGDYTVTATSGTTTRSLQFTLVDHADTLALMTDAPAACFSATNGGRYVANLKWTYTVDGALAYGSANCIGLDASADTNHDGLLTIVATVDGLTTQVDVVPFH